MKTTPKHGWFTSGVTVLTTILVGLSTIALGETELREFSNSEGKTLKARLVAATDTTAKLQLDNGREIEAGINYFSEADQKYITEWRKNYVPEIDYRFDLKSTKKRVKRDTRREGPVEVTYETWKYEVEVENLSGVDLSDLELQYKIYKEANADVMYQEEGLAVEGKYQVRKGKGELKPIPHLRSVTMETDQIVTSKSELDPDYVYTSGSKSNKKDDLEGFWVKIFHNGKEVFESKSSHAAIKNAKW